VLQILLKLLIQVKSVHTHDLLQFLQACPLCHIQHIGVAVTLQLASQVAVVQGIQKLLQVVLLALLRKGPKVVRCVLDQRVVDVVVRTGQRLASLGPQKQGLVHALDHGFTTVVMVHFVNDSRL
jgi:hypothetical protein